MGHRGQEPNESTDDAVWQDLVARLEGRPTDATGQDTSDVSAVGSQADGQSAHRPPASDSGSAADASRANLTDRERADAIFRDQPFSPTGPRDYSSPDAPEQEDGFVPAEPPPIGSGDPLTVLAWIGAAGGPILLLLFAMFWRGAPLGATLGVLTVFLAGAAYLVTKLPKHRDAEDDGAEV